MTRDRWLACVAAALGVAVSDCKKTEGPAVAREVPPPQQGFRIPPPYDTVCSVTMDRPDASVPEASAPLVMQLGVGGDDGSGTCWEPISAPTHGSNNCGPMPRMPELCSYHKPVLPNVQAVVRPKSLEPAVVAAPLRAALRTIMACGRGRSRAVVKLTVDASGKVTAGARTGDGWLASESCVGAALAAVAFPSGPGEIMLELTST